MKIRIKFFAVGTMIGEVPDNFRELGEDEQRAYAEAAADNATELELPEIHHQPYPECVEAEDGEAIWVSKIWEAWREGDDG